MDTLKRHAPTAARIALGLIFTVFGLNGFFSFLPMPPPPERAAVFFGALHATGYMLPLIKGTEVVAGLLLLSGRVVPFALTLLAPVVVNIVAFHLFLAPKGLPLALLALVLGVYSAWNYRDAYRPLFASSRVPARPRTAQSSHVLKAA